MRHSTTEPTTEAYDILRGAISRSVSPSHQEPESIELGVPEFPEIAWRGAFADYREAVNGTTEASDVLHFGALWAALAVALGRRTWMFAGERVYPNAYIIEYGPTADKKTTAQRMIVHCGLIPEHVQVIRNMGSTEGLADKIKRDDSADAVALMFWEEFTSLLARGRWSGSTILEFVTETFDCPPTWGLEYRKTKVEIAAPTPTILAGTTAEWFWKNSRPDDFYGGFGNRFFYLTGKKKPAIANPTEPNGPALQRVREAMHRIAVIQPTAAIFTSDASKLWERFYGEFENKERQGLYGAATKRIHVYVRKLAMTYAAMEGTLPQITLEQLKASIAVGLYGAECARVLVDSQNATRPEAQLEQKVLDWLRKHGGSKKRYMQQTLSKAIGSCEIFNRVLLSLAKADWIEERDGRVYLKHG
jgi:hypothetical protein